MRRIPALALLAVLALIFVAVAGDKLPDTEKELLQYAQQHMNRRTWREADTALRRFIEKFPDSKQAEQAHYMLGQLHTWYVRRYDTAREWLQALIKKYPEGTYAWSARFLIADSYARQRQNEKAIAVLQEIALRAPRAHERTNAAQRILRLKGKSFTLYVNQTFTEGEEARVNLGVRNVDKVDFTVWRIAYEELIERLDRKQPSLPAAAARVPRDRWKKLKEWPARYEAGHNRYINKQIRIDVKERGFYVVEGTHDGVTMTVAFPVNRYGLIAKTGADKTVVFAQDRVTGAPIPGMRVRILFPPDGEKEIVTGEDGTKEIEKAGQRRFLIGTKDGDYSFANVQTSGWNSAKESRYYIATERPIYRPNQEVHFKIIHRTEEGATLAIQKDLRVRVRIFDPKNNEVYSRDHGVNEFGSLAGSLLLGDEPPLGVYRIHVEPLVESAPILDWRGRYGNFRVDEYRKPEFKVGVTFDKPYYVMGDKLSATIAADYYFGSPVPNAKVTYKVMRRTHWGMPKYRCGWYSWYIEDYGWQPRYAGKEIAKGSGKLDENGRLAVSVPLERWTHDARYTVVAQVTDLSRRMVEGAGAVRVNRAEFSLSTELDRYVYKPGDQVRLTVTAKRPDGVPVEGREVKVTAYRRYWRHKEYEEKELVSAGAVTNAEGQAEITIGIAEAGSFVLKATATDRRGNETTAHRWIWVASRDWNGGYVKWNGVDILPDKPAYQQGDTATFLVSSEVKDQTVLVTFESTRLHHVAVVKLNGHTATVSVKLDDAAMAPNFFATVTALHGSKVYRRQRSVMVDPSERFLTVEIKPDKETYRPREKAAIEIVARDRDGKPVSAEVSVALVDESIFALQSEYAGDIRKFFVRKRYNRVHTTTSLEYWQWGAGRLEAEEIRDSAAPGAPAAEGFARGGAKKRGKMAMDAKDKDAYAETEIRSEFADTMFWTASVVTDENGRATVRIDKVADNLTTWRVTARAMTREGLMGQAAKEILVRKDVIVRLHTPRFFTQGDKSTVSAVVHNYLDSPKQVRVELTATGLELTGPSTLDVEIPAQGEKRLDWPALVKTPGKADITIKALTDEESDAMKLSVPMLPHGSMAWTSSSHLVEGRLDTSMDLPPDAIPEATEMTVSVSPTHAATVLDALDYLADYPYGCVEQTMSRFLPSAITAQVLRRLNLRRPELEKELPDMIRTGLQRLYNFQHQDGGWGWWKNDTSNPFTTAYVVYGLAMAQRADVAVSPQVMGRAVNALKRLLPKAETEEHRAYMLFALSMAGHKQKDVRNALADNLNRLAAVHKAMLALVLHRDGERDEAKRVLKSLEGDARTSGATAYFQGPETYRWTGHNVETTAFGLMAFLEIDPEHALVPKMVSWLAMSREGHHWVSTRQTAMVVYAVSGYLAKTGDLDPDLTLTLKVNGQQIFSERVTKENWRSFDGTVRIDRELLKAGKNRIELDAQGRGKPVCSIYLKHFKRADTFEPSKGGLRVERKYELVRHDGSKQVFVPLDNGEKVTSGDEIRVTLTVKADRAYRYLMLEDPMPAGFEAVREQHSRWGRWSWWYAHKEFRDEKVAVAITHLPEGERTIQYTMRAETPGNFRILPTLVWNMYRVGEGANSAGRHITVQPD